MNEEYIKSCEEKLEPIFKQIDDVFFVTNIRKLK